MLLKNLRRLAVIIALLCVTTFTFASPEASLMLHISNLGGDKLAGKVVAGHPITYFTTLTPEEKALHSSPLVGTIPAEKAPGVKNYAGMFIFRTDHKDFVVDLKITDPAADERVIWEGKILGDANTHEVKTVVVKTDEVNYSLHIMLSKAGEPMPSFSIGIMNKK